ncbi:minor tail protein [Mycobacterium phage Simpliphy]|nr:minor tail protein [Mycobacterium phage DrDrey]AGT13699.1 minor tail protein [Mycobacterium phage DrDrey]AXH50561.1 minor tail protein [Mycobacterium phage Simpliphy]QAY06555.1 minor tail protein [Mycobacterium phage Cookies]WNN94857.1 minor tail protein [Mycobacterium phage StolenFromERC]
MARVGYEDPANLHARLRADPYNAATAAQMAALAQINPPDDTVVTFYGKTYGIAGVSSDYIEVTAEFPRNAVETATIVLKHSDPMVPHVMKCYEEVVPVTIEIGAMRWSGRVDTFDYAMKDGEYTVTLQCVGDYNWFNKILVWPNWLLPIQVQIPSRAVFIGPAITCLKTMIGEQCLRLQLGMWELVNNLGSGNLDWQAWFGTALMSDGNPLDTLMTPIVVVPTNPLFDTSPWISINGRMDSVATLAEQTLKDLGLHLTASLWLPGDPQPKGLLFPLKKATIVVDVVDRSGVTGPTGTFIDGLIKDVVDLQESVLGKVLAPFLNPGNAYAPEGVNIAPTLGVNFVKPWALFVDHPRGGLTEFHLNGHHPLAHTIIGGGKSPKWLNDLINATMSFFVDIIQIVIGITGVPSGIFDGTFDDILLAFQLIENFDRRKKLGPFGYPEYFVQTGASAYTLDEWFALRSGMWDTRGYHSVQLTFENGYPYTIGKDLFVGGLASFAMLDKLYTDYVEKVVFKDSASARNQVQVFIGDGKAQESPVAKLQRRITGFQEFVQIVTMSNH